ncbi:MAG: hypothetical protein IH867_13340 [Chloroflexi bacterium]|nr:hypothetical protein [Chloroflexota bacterium]
MKSSLSEHKNMIGSRLGPVFGSTSYRALFLALATVLIVSVTGCGSDGGDGDADVPGASSTELRDENEGQWLITQPDRVYSVDDFVGVGWKKSKQLETETLTNSIDAWYGFYRQKDIELRFYESHEAAVAHGVGPAQETMGRGAGARIGAATVWTVNISLYGAYAVAGNVVMMCELELASCEALVDALE